MRLSNMTGLPFKLMKAFVKIMWGCLTLATLASVMMAGLTIAVRAQETPDPFVRGLRRLDDVEEQRKSRLKKVEMELVAARKEMAAAKRGARGGGEARNGAGAAGRALAEIQGDPGFDTAFRAPRYRLDGLLVAYPSDVPVIHVTEDGLRRSNMTLYWSGAERRWVYRLAMNESYLTVAKKFKMHPFDVLAMNNNAKPAALARKKTLFVSPRDNGPLVHTVRKGETLNELSALYGVPIKMLKALNTLSKKGWLIIGQRLHIRDKTLNRDEAIQAVPAPTELDLNAERMARKHYVRLARYGDLSGALRGAREFYQDNKDYMDSDLILRLEMDGAGRRAYFMDIGPMRSERHATGYCALFTRQHLACETVRRVPGPERLNTFESQAVVRVSPTVFYDGEVSSDTVEISKTKDIEYQLVEGQVLGADEGVVVKITPNNIYVADGENKLLALNLNYLPEVDQEVLATRQKAKRQAQLDAAATAVAIAASSVDAPNIETLNIVKRLTEKETQRREGSTGTIE